MLRINALIAGLLSFVTVAGLATVAFSQSSANTPSAKQDDPKGALSMHSQKITTCFWFKENAEQAVEFYVATLQNSRVLSVDRMPAEKPGDVGPAISLTFELEGQRFIAINGNPGAAFNDSVSLMVACETQAEVDHLWTKLTADGGAESQCGWLKDKYGVSWQIIPTTLIELMHDKDPAKAKRVVDAMLQMKKIDIAKLRAAYEGK